MTEEPTPIAYTALQPGVPVLLSDGSQFATVESVLHIEDLDVFDGIVVDVDGEQKFVDADHIASIFTSAVHTTVGPGQVGDLPVPDGPPVYRADASDDTGNSLSDRLGRLFGRGKWKREEH
jgi:hypothetical protein